MRLMLEPIEPTKAQIFDLYSLLKTRSHSISHKAMPSFEAHEYFVKNQPYRAWYIIKKSDQICGTIYVHHDNSLGLNNAETLSADDIHLVLLRIKEQIAPLPAIDSVRSGVFFLNVAASNSVMQEKLEAIGCQLLQKSYVLSEG